MVKILIDENVLNKFSQYSDYNFYKHKVIKSCWLDKNTFNDNEVVFPYGSHHFIQECKKYLVNVKLLILLEEHWKLNYDFYVTLFKKNGICNFLNKNYKLLTINTMRSKKERFIRPNTSKKIFTGDLYTKEKLLNLYPHLSNDTEIITSEPKPIEEEWRLTVINRKIISWSEYSWESKPLKPRNKIPHSILKLASEVCQCRYQPLSAYTLDVCISNNQPKIVEINSINTSCFYNSNIEQIFKVIENEF